MRISPDGKEVKISPTDLMMGALILQIHESLPIKVVAKQTKQGLVIILAEDGVDV